MDQERRQPEQHGYNRSIAAGWHTFHDLTTKNNIIFKNTPSALHKHYKCYTPGTKGSLKNQAQKA
jgi:hypothetical protein